MHDTVDAHAPQGIADLLPHYVVVRNKTFVQIAALVTNSTLVLLATLKQNHNKNVLRSSDSCAHTP